MGSPHELFVSVYLSNLFAVSGDPNCEHRMRGETRQGYCVVVIFCGCLRHRCCRIGPLVNKEEGRTRRLVAPSSAQRHQKERGMAALLSDFRHLFCSFRDSFGCHCLRTAYGCCVVCCSNWSCPHTFSSCNFIAVREVI